MSARRQGGDIRGALPQDAHPDDATMTQLSRPEDLPDFCSPPVVETVLSLQFEPIHRFSTVHVGLLWQKFRKDLLLMEEHPPLPPVVETFGKPTQSRIEVTIEEKPPLPRVWFLNESRTELIQVQADRFIHNWRKAAGSSTPYPRYEPIRERFREELAVFERFLSDEKLGRIVINQCEVTYVNHIEPCGVWGRHGQMQTVFRNWTSLESSFLPEAEGVAVHQRFVIPDETGGPVGRLHASVAPHWKKADGSPLLVLNVTARGAPLGEGTDGAFAFFDLGRRWIVQGFTDLTTSDMHCVWERRDA